MMKAVLLTPTLLGSITQIEVKELLGKPCELIDDLCFVKACSPQDIASLAFHSQSARRVGVVLAELSLKNPNLEECFEKAMHKLDQQLDKDAFDSLCSHAQRFGVSTVKTVKESLDSPDISRLVADAFIKTAARLKKNFVVDLNNPDCPVLCLVTQTRIVVCVDVIGFPLQKRPFKLFAYPGSVNGSFAYSLARLAGVRKKSVVVDPFCQSGDVLLEIALFQQGTSPFRFQKRFFGFQLPALKDAFEKQEFKEKKKTLKKDIYLFGFSTQTKMMLAAQKNAKLAGVHESIKFSKADIDWIDTKFDEKSVDFIISNPPQVSKRLGNEKKIMKLYDELFYQARFLLAASGSLALILTKEEGVKQLAQKNGFETQKEMKLHSGGQTYKFLLFSRTDKNA